MAKRNTDSSYGSIARAFHWGMFVIIIGLLVLGNYMYDLPTDSPAEVSYKFELYDYHKSFGLLILMLVTLRLAWRMKNPVPQLPGTMSRMESLSAHAMHILLYLIMFVQPLFGWLRSSFAGRPVKFFGMDFPALVGKDKALSDFFHEAHEVTAKLLVLALLIHIAASLYHHFIRKDDVLTRMLSQSDKSQ